MLLCEDRARPDPGGDGVGANPNGQPFKVPCGIHKVSVQHDTAVLKAHARKNRNRGYWDSVLACREIGHDRHFADVELQFAGHPPKCPVDGIYLDERLFETADCDVAVLQLA